jgi:hypothetical protein
VRVCVTVHLEFGDVFALRGNIGRYLLCMMRGVSRAAREERCRGLKPAHTQRQLSVFRGWRVKERLDGAAGRAGGRAGGRRGGVGGGGQHAKGTS